MFGNIIKISECGRFAAMETANYPSGSGVRRTDRRSTADEALQDARNNGTGYTSTPSSTSYYIAVNTEDLLVKSPTTFAPLVKVYEGMQRDDPGAQRLTGGALEVAKRAYSNTLRRKVTAVDDAAEARTKQAAAAVQALFNPDID